MHRRAQDTLEAGCAECGQRGSLWAWGAAGSKERSFLHGLPDPAELTAWIHNLQAVFSMAAECTKHGSGFPQALPRCRRDKMFLGKPLQQGAGCWRCCAPRDSLAQCALTAVGLEFTGYVQGSG